MTPFHTPCADVQSALPQFLRDHIGSGVRVEEAVPNDLADRLMGAPVVALGAALLTAQCDRTMLTERRAQLKISLLAEVIFPCRLTGAEPFTFPFDQHGEFERDLVIEWHDK